MDCQDLACQLIRDHSYVNVVMGGGQKNFYPEADTLPADGTSKGARKDGKNLVDEWKTAHANDGYCFIGKPSDLETCNASSSDYILGNNKIYLQNLSFFFSQTTDFIVFFQHYLTPIICLMHINLPGMNRVYWVM